jgi:membrane protein implicated in regulation of membrane protease activity
MIELLTTITPFHWLALGLILLTAEVLGTAGFLIGAGVAALGMGVVVWLFPGLAPGWQIVVYAISAVGATIFYFQVFHDSLEAQGRPLLNKRAKRLIGHQFELADDIELGEGKVQIGDTFWKVTTDKPLTKGTVVEVTDANRMSLVIAAK